MYLGIDRADITPEELFFIMKKFPKMWKDLKEPLEESIIDWCISNMETNLLEEDLCMILNMKY